MSFTTFREIDEETIRPHHTGVNLLHDPALNKGTAFTPEERRRLGIEGLLPASICTQDKQVARERENYLKKPDDLEKYIFLMALQDRNETLFYRVVSENIEEMMPIIYTPVVGLACQQYGHIFRRSRGIFITRDFHGRMVDILRNWPEKDIRVIVITDGERILGLGDLGANGMGIPVGKLSLYTVCAGVHPMHSLPVTLDVGTNNQELLDDPLYLGTRQPRLRGSEYYQLVDEFIQAALEIFPHALIQFEDFGNHNAFRLLSNYRNRILTFNDDIQGTAGVALAGLYSALRMIGKPLGEQRILFHGAGEAAIGIGELVVSAMMEAGLDHTLAKSRCWFMDSKGLVIKNRQDLQEHKLPFAHDHKPIGDLLEAVRILKPTTLIGVSGQPAQFSREVVEEMARLNDRPIIFALSNPTSRAECTAEQAYGWSQGKAIFASGSPFGPVTCHGHHFVPGQSNNAYIFPGIGLGAIAVGAKRITDEMFSTAAKTLARLVSEEDLEKGCIFPPLTKIREVSAHIAASVAEVAYRNDLARRPRPEDLLEFMRTQQYQPAYKTYV
ncbi:MAG: NAD-dependent malic enzyme [Deltaproteobacteria bacterium]|nr:NAD-dependent malic enzyme [Deltaproteobacteria bacterium]